MDDFHRKFLIRLICLLIVLSRILPTQQHTSVHTLVCIQHASRHTEPRHRNLQQYNLSVKTGLGITMISFSHLNAMQALENNSCWFEAILINVVKFGVVFN